jgi:hypothetical protein
VSDFKSIKELAEYIIKLNDDEVEYNKYLEFKKQPYSDNFQSYEYYSTLNPYCQICKKMADDLEPQRINIKNKKMVQIRKFSEYYYKVIENSEKYYKVMDLNEINTYDEFVVNIKKLFGINKERRIFKIFPSKLKMFGDVFFNNKFDVDDDSKFLNLIENSQLDFIHF